MRILTLIFFSALAFSLSGQGIEFYEGNWQEALEKAAEEDKIIFVDAYATWCGPCKRMSKNVFPQEEVGQFFNDKFINMKIDMEKGMGLSFRKKYPVRAFPTLLFINSDGETILKETGARKARGLIDLGKKALKKNDQSGKYLKLYEEGDRSYTTMYKLVKSLNKVGKPSIAYANEYLDTQDDLTTTENLKFLLTATTRVDSRIYEALEENKDAVIALVGEEKYQETVYNAALRTADKAAEFRVEDLLQEAQKIVKKQAPDLREQFNYESAKLYYGSTRDLGPYLKATQRYVKKVVDQDARLLYEVSSDLMSTWKSNSAALDYAEELAETCAKNSGMAKYYYHWGTVLHTAGKNDEALSALEKSLEIAKEEKSNTAHIKALIHNLKQS